MIELLKVLRYYMLVSVYMIATAPVWIIWNILDRWIIPWLRIVEDWVASLDPLSWAMDIPWESSYARDKKKDSHES